MLSRRVWGSGEINAFPGRGTGLRKFAHYRRGSLNLEPTDTPKLSETRRATATRTAAMLTQAGSLLSCHFPAIVTTKLRTPAAVRGR
jgi:hypothetical protein